MGHYSKKKVVILFCDISLLLYWLVILTAKLKGGSLIITQDNKLCDNTNWSISGCNLICYMCVSNKYISMFIRSLNTT